MEKPKDIISELQKNVNLFWEWSLKFNSREEILNGENDSPSYPKWNQIEENLESIFKNINFDELTNKTLDNIIFLIAQQWDIGIILNWFNKGDERIGQLGMTKFQLKKLSQRGLNSDLADAKAQFAISLYKIENRNEAIELLLKYYNENNEYIRRCSLQSLNKLNYEQLNLLLDKSWKMNEENERILCLQIWSETDKKLFTHYCKIAEKDEREYLRNYASKLRKELNQKTYKKY